MVDGEQLKGKGYACEHDADKRRMWSEGLGVEIFSCVSVPCRPFGRTS